MTLESQTINHHQPPKVASISTAQDEERKGLKKEEPKSKSK